MQKYDHIKIEKKWQKKWENQKLYKTADSNQKKKFYILDMFPYPSGEGLHVGHPKGYIATDVISRSKRMQGFNVLHPMGFDAFGLPAENYAIKNKTNPMVAVQKNVARYKKQLEIIGLDYDWSREINTTDPNFYKWTQWAFLKMFKKGLAHESFEPINWCPSCKTGLANEDIEDGKCERCGTIVEKKPLKQWVIKITKYADKLLKDLGKLDWPDSIKDLQRNWIGKSEGGEFDFKIKNSEEKITVYTTRADTIFGVTYVVLAPEHKLVQVLKSKIENWNEVEKYLESIKNKSEIERTAEGKEKTGVELCGLKAINPVNGGDVPIWIADYVLADYGTGAVMAVPEHDDRDFAFAKKYNLEIKEVIIPKVIDKRNPPVEGKQSVKRQNVHAIVKNNKGEFLCLKWKKFNWTTFPMGGVEANENVVEAGKREVLEETGYKNLKFIKILGNQVEAEYFAAHKDQNRISLTNAVLFELINEDQDEVTQEEKDSYDIVWLPESDITVDKMTHAEMGIWLERLKGRDIFVDDGILINSGKFNDLKSEDARDKIIKDFGKKVTKYKLRDWVFSRQRYWGEPFPIVHDREGKSYAVCEKELPIILPKVKSYEPTGTGESPLAAIKSWVEVYGHINKNGDFETLKKSDKKAQKFFRETNTMPQWAGSSWYYLRYLDPKNKTILVDKKKEKNWSPVDFYVGGAEHATRHLIYARFWHKFLNEIGAVSTSEPFKKLQHVGLIMAEDGKKMSKRYNNVVNPDDIVKNYGADSLRVYEMFMGPFDQSISWSTDNIIGVRRFIEKTWRLAERISKVKQNKEIQTLKHKTIKKVTEDIQSMAFNTAISSLMIYSNALEKEKEITKDDYQTLLILLAPFAPHITEEVWQNILKNKKSIHISVWPKYDKKFLKENKITYAIQVNGKLRGELTTSVDTKEEEILAKAHELVSVERHLVDKKVIKTIFVPNRLLNIVVK
jgi:leucyl-tRNA synthetase